MVTLNFIGGNLRRASKESITVAVIKPRENKISINTACINMVTDVVFY